MTRISFVFFADLFENVLPGVFFLERETMRWQHIVWGLLRQQIGQKPSRNDLLPIRCPIDVLCETQLYRDNTTHFLLIPFCHLHAPIDIPAFLLELDKVLAIVEDG